MDADIKMTYQRRFLKRSSSDCANGLSPKRRNRIIANEGSGYNHNAFSTSWRFESEQKRNNSCSQVADRFDPFPVNLLKELDTGKYGSVTKDIMELVRRMRQLVDWYYAMDPELPYSCHVVQNEMAPMTTKPASPKVIDLEDDQDESTFAVKRSVPAAEQSHSGPVVIIDSDDDISTENHACPYMEVNLKKPSGNFTMKDFVDRNFAQPQRPAKGDAYIASAAKLIKDKCAQPQSSVKGDAYIASGAELIKDKGAQPQSSAEGDANIASETELIKGKGEYIGTDDDMHMEESDEASETNSDGLGDIWNEMKVALECSKDAADDSLVDEYEDGDEEECEHSFIMKDDIGDVCRICGVIKRGIETIIEYNFSKGTKSTRTYRYEGRGTRDLDQTELVPDGFKSSGDFTASDIYPHPRHKKEMKPHQVEGFNFLVSNLVTDNPGGCILAHAPGSGKTFMIISFLQSFMAKYPAARPLVVLPRGILAIWKKEFLRWQVEEIPLYDFYSVKADSRTQQLEVLKDWEKQRSVLFLGYKQFSSIICDTGGGQVAVACQNFLLKVPSILILDEGHTPRNQDTDVLTSLERIETTRKVVLSGTLYQNHVKEVFNILNLVRPRFIKSETSKAIMRRILSRADISGKKNLHGKDNEFYELIEQTLTKDVNQTRKATVIQDLREMTKHVLHYYKGDNLDELPGLLDFSVILRLSAKQKSEAKDLKTLNKKFSISSQGSAIYVHPRLKPLAEKTGAKDRVDEEKIDAILEKFDLRDGVKANFYLNLLKLCESSGEKLLVFSQYLLPLKFLERMTAKLKGYGIGREMFMITGESDAEMREISMDKFNNSSDARVFFGSIRACGEGISLVGASRIMVLDVPLNPSVTRQAIGRAFRPGQVRKVYTYRLIAEGSPEEEDHITCFKKESIAKLWFEWDHYSSHQKLEMDEVDKNNCGDMFLETARLNEDVVAVTKR